jgi:hypothetical protein
MSAQGSGGSRTTTGLSPNGTHQRPHADASARGRDRLVSAKTLIARGQALYVSRLAAWDCSASRVRSSILVREYPLAFDKKCLNVVVGVAGLIARCPVANLQVDHVLFRLIGQPVRIS